MGDYTPLNTGRPDALGQSHTAPSARLTWTYPPSWRVSTVVLGVVFAVVFVFVIVVSLPQTTRNPRIWGIDTAGKESVKIPSSYYAAIRALF